MVALDTRRAKDQLKNAIKTSKVWRILCTQLREEKSTKWARLLPIVQSMKNRRYHRDIGRSPFEAMEIEPEPEKFEDWTESIKAALTDNPTYWPDSKEYDEIVKECTDTGSYHVNKENVSHRAEAAEVHISELNQALQHQVESIEKDSTIAELNRIDEKICQHRAGAVRFQQKQAEKMLESSKNRYGSVDVGKTVRVPIDTVDRPKIGHPSLFGVLLETNDGFYKIVTSNGILPQKLTRNQFVPASNNFIDAEDVPEKETSFPSAVGAESLTGSQGHKHCKCINGCVNGRCVCVKSNVLCNNRCHNS